MVLVVAAPMSLFSCCNATKLSGAGKHVSTNTQTYRQANYSIILGQCEICCDISVNILDVFFFSSYYGNWNHVRLLVSCLVRPSVCHNFLNARKLHFHILPVVCLLAFCGLCNEYMQENIKNNIYFIQL